MMISFGPVPSRRLGKSLGINNIISPKTCSYGCVYCQVGNTPEKCIERKTFFQPENIYKKVEEHIQQLSRDKHPDYLTFVSNGEPTLDINLGEAIKLLKPTGIPVAVITNASLLFDETVRNDLYFADWVSLKIDAGDNDTWQKVNRPSAGLKFGKTIEGINLFADGYKGILCTETMLIDGMNDTINNLTNVSELIKNIKPKTAYLAIPTRPPTLDSVNPPDSENLNLAWHTFNNNHINTEFLTGFEGTDTGFTGNIYDDILNITAVHPLRQDSLIRLLQNDNADFRVVKSLIKQRLIRSTIYNGNKYYLREYHLHI
jgi:wyosine [tRNA(Phe)-imidazoG37] synthetase (radical SAM superfamily)